MKKNLTTNIIYKPLNDPQSDFSVQVLYLFNETGFLDFSETLNVYKKYFRNKDDLVFRNLDELGDFVKKLIEEFGAPKAYILSVEDYNAGLERVREKLEYRELFMKVGTELENPDYKNHIASGIFGKIFT
jgi:hypothetical protein